MAQPGQKSELPNFSESVARAVPDLHSCPMLRRTWLPVLPVLLVLVSTITPAADASLAPGTGTRATDASRASAVYEFTTVQFENRLLSRTNTRRARVGCAPVRINASLVRAARAHSTRMASTRAMAHQLPGEARFDVRITRQGYTGWRMLAENIAYGAPPTPATVFSSWVHSAPHRRNIDNCALREIGLGVAYSGGDAWATMDLGRR